jgi:hypothetical protein
MPSLKSKPDTPSPFKSALPAGLRIGKDKLLLQVSFYEEAIIMHDRQAQGGTYRFISAYDMAHALAREMTFSSGLLPPGALWWSNTRSGPVVAIWVEPGVRRLALQVAIDKPAERYDLPLPGLIFICRPGRPPHVYALTKRPAGPKAQIFKAPFPNVYDDGGSCPGSHKYPADVGEIPDSFLTSFFTNHVEGSRSKKYGADIRGLWKALDKQDKWPLDDLVYHGTLADLMRMGI